MYFYELHEGDGDMFADLILARDEEMSPDEFLGLVQEIRERVLDTYDQDTLIEAIALELERDHDFVFVSDDRLTAAVNVSAVAADTFLADLTGDADASDDGDDEEDEVDEDGTGSDFRSVIADYRPPGRPRPH